MPAKTSERGWGRAVGFGGCAPRTGAAAEAPGEATPAPVLPVREEDGVPKIPLPFAKNKRNKLRPVLIADFHIQAGQ